MPKDFRVPHHKKIDIKRLPTMVSHFASQRRNTKTSWKNILLS